MMSSFWWVRIEPAWLFSELNSAKKIKNKKMVYKNGRIIQAEWKEYKIRIYSSFKSS